MNRRLALLVCALGWLPVFQTPRSSEAAVKTKTVIYKHGDIDCRGFLAWDDSVKGARPGVLVLHEWWGLNDYARHRAEQLAEMGYLALAADMYGEGKLAEHPQEAGEMATKVRSNIADWRARAKPSRRRALREDRPHGGLH